MLDLDYINKNTIWVARFSNGRRETGTYDKIKKYYEYNSPYDYVKDIDTVNWKGQPKELQAFYKAYEYANYELRLDLFEVEDFYKEWIKDPNKFVAQHKPVIDKLSKVLENIDVYSDIIIVNYDGKTLGNHLGGNWVEAFKILDTDFDVISNEEGKIIIQSDDEELVNKFDYLANQKAIEHDRYIGDGKYWRN